jgi:hypothetical protein
VSQASLSPVSPIEGFETIDGALVLPMDRACFELQHGEYHPSNSRKLFDFAGFFVVVPRTFLAVATPVAIHNRPELMRSPLAAALVSWPARLKTYRV